MESQSYMLQYYVDALEAGAQQFETTATKLKRKTMCQNVKVALYQR